jgi:hypothetical protein
MSRIELFEIVSSRTGFIGKVIARYPSENGFICLVKEIGSEKTREIKEKALKVIPL